MKNLKESKKNLESKIEALLNDFTKEFPEIEELEISTVNHFQSGKLINVSAKISVKV